MRKYIVSSKEAGQTLFNYTKKILKNAPSSVIYKLFRKKDVKVNGHWQNEKYIVNENEEISIFLSEDKFVEFENSLKEASVSHVSDWIVYEDKNVLIINKPRGVLVQKAIASDIALDDMVISYLMNKGEYDPNVEKSYTPSPAHRIDRNTAGLVVFGKSLRVLQELAGIMADKNKAEKRYLALVKGEVTEGKIDVPLTKNGSLVFTDKENGKEAITEYKLVEKVSDYSLVDIHLLTGRTHQIRVHFAYIEHPLVGDAKYGDFSLNKEIEKKYGFSHQFLVAYYLAFHHLEGELTYLNNKPFMIELPQECMELLTKLKDNK